MVNFISQEFGAQIPSHSKLLNCHQNKVGYKTILYILIGQKYLHITGYDFRSSRRIIQRIMPLKNRLHDTNNWCRKLFSCDSTLSLINIQISVNLICSDF